MKKLLTIALMLSFSTLIVSCGEDEEPNNGNENESPVEGSIKVIVATNISSDVTWSSDSIYELASRVTVLPGATLTIEAGTIIKGQAGTGSNATALLVARGGMLMAEGTATAPIIFTSVADEIMPADVQAGNFSSPNLDPDIDGLWGGIIVLGAAPISASNDDGQVSEVQIEGIPTSDANGLYGGDNATDNSGVIRYISIRHGGSNIGSGNEINGLTLGGVGSGTTIEYVEVVANQDDGIEWFGGTVNVSNVVIWNSGDDSMDTDQAWNGTCSNFIIVTPKGGSAFELDGPEGEFTQGNHTFTNGVVYAGEDIDHLIDFDPSTNANINNVYFFGIVTETDVEEYTPSIQTVSGIEYTYGTPVEGASLDASAIFGELSVTEVGVNANTVGPDASAFGWTWAGNSGALSDLGL